jgi:hypothetical protein
VCEHEQSGDGAGVRDYQGGERRAGWSAGLGWSAGVG